MVTRGKPRSSSSLSGDRAEEKKDLDDDDETEVIGTAVSFSSVPLTRSS